MILSFKQSNFPFRIKLRAKKKKVFPKDVLSTVIHYLRYEKLTVWITRKGLFAHFNSGAFILLKECNAIYIYWNLSTIITKTCLFKYTENFTIKKRKFSHKKFWYFHVSAQNIDGGYSLEPPHRGGSNEYPQSMFLSRNKENNVYPCKPQFYYIKVGFKGVKIIYVWFRDGSRIVFVKLPILPISPTDQI